uniref:extracellular matrix protein FRAS1-like n=1 Tax=Styela clava TaxID=7725 RepID=UPI00193A7F78|nr:extracellular matrix protein FRAS1-like [Styela clava]
MSEITKYIFYLLVLIAIATSVQGECIEDGTRHKNSSIWRKDSCTTCSCNNHIIICHKEKCKDPQCDVTKGGSLIIPSNKCCPECTKQQGRSCLKDGSVVAHNTHWKGSNCTECACNNGAIQCSPLTCNLDLQCGYGELPWKRPGDCCQKCVSTGASCKYNDVTYRDGDVWTPSKCERAKCSNGEINYQIAHCEPVVCPPSQRSVLLPDQCCPQCVGAPCISEGKQYKSGEQFKPDSCRHCTCLNGDVTCHTTSCDVINEETLDGSHHECRSGEVKVTRQEECCPDCVSSQAHCDYEGVRHYHGDLWNGTKCQMCSCNKGIVRCFELQCSEVTCERNQKLIHKPGSCCPECVPVTSQCFHNGLLYRHGDEWQTSPCERCACIHGVTQCFNADCQPCPEHTVPVHMQGECCPTCEPVTCHADCLTCNGPKYGQCTTCKNTRHLLQEGKCVRRCLPGFYQEGKTCKRCHSTCETCTLANSPNTCTSCKSPLQLQDGTCVEDCIPGYFDDDGLCKHCMKGCARCLSASVCVECTNKTMLVQNGDCADRCGKDFFYSDNICKPCHSSCASCSSDSNICDTCPPGKIMQNHLCVSECSQKYYKTKDGKCAACHESCASCVGPLVNQCSTCSEKKLLHSGKCIDNCPAGFYPSDGVCKACHLSCHLCVGGSPSDCTACSSNTQMLQLRSDLFATGQCVENCDEGHYMENRVCRGCHETCARCDGPSNTNCTSCFSHGFLLMTSHMTSQLRQMCLSADECWALSLVADERTQQCYDKTKLAECNQMKKSMILTLGSSDDLDIEKCVTVCPKGTYKKTTPSGSMCVPCTRGCASCDSKDNCIECDDKKLRSQMTSQCVESCEDGYFALKGQCESCPSACTTCELPPSGGTRPRCTSCKDTGAVLQFGECIAGCAEQFYSDVAGSSLGTPICKECDWSCNRCWGPDSNQCLECMPGSKLQNGRCVKQCTSGYYQSSSVCLPCKTKHCVSCADENSCSACRLPHHIHENKCVSSCPQGYVHDPTTNTCVACPSHCLHCTTPTSCDQCDAQTFMQAETDPLDKTPRHRRSSLCGNCRNGYFGNEMTRLCQANNEAPALSILRPIIVTMNGRSVIDDKIIEASDKDSADDQLKLILEAQPRNGRIEVDNIRVRIGDEIPLLKIKQGSVWFVPDEIVRLPRVARVKVTDGHLESASQDINILIVSTHSPMVVRNKPLVVSSGQTTEISLSNLMITDDDNSADVTITIVSSPKYGFITNTNHVDTEVLDFTLEDIDQNVLRYTPRKGLKSKSTLYDVIGLQVSDKYHVINVALRVEIVPKASSAPSLVTNKPSRVRSKGLLHITSELLNTVGKRVKDKSKLVYALKPVNFTSGEVVKISPMSSDDPMLVTDNWVKMEDTVYRSPPLMRFSQEDVDEGDVWYRDLGGLGEVEAFEFQVIDENYRPARHVTDDVFRVSVIPENTEKPHIARGVSFPPQMTATEDHVTVLHSGYIRYTDEDTPDRDLIYNITKSIPPFFGSIEHADNPLVPITVFTQSEIDSNKIIFRPASEIMMSSMGDGITDEVIMDDDYDDIMDGETAEDLSEYGYTYDHHKYEAFTFETRGLPKEVQFEYTVSDGQHTLDPAKFTIKLVDQGNTAGPTFTNPHPRIDVTQGGTAPIGTQQLSITDPDTHHRDLIFTLVKRPRHGSVVRNDRGMRVMLREGDSFTHDEIQRNSLHYVHDGSDEVLTDQLQVSVTDVTHTATKVIQVSVLKTDSTGPTPDLSSELSLVVNGGSVATLKRENLAYADHDSTDAEIIYHVESELLHGILDSEVLGDIVSGDTFSQADINIGHIKYRSSVTAGAKPLTDELHFSVTDRSGNKLSNQLLTITITPADSQPPVVTVGTGIQVEEGGSVLITPRDVIATDADTPKKDLKITVTTKPRVGYFLNTLRTDVLNADEEEVWFSMQDVLDGAIYYVQSLHRHSEPKKDFFKFTVSDGHNVSPNYRMNITITPTNDEEPSVKTNTLICKNGHATMILNASLLVHDEDTPTNELVFTVTSLPRHGYLVKFSEKMPHDMMNKLKMMGNGALQLDMMEEKKLMKLRVGSTFTYQDVLDQLICFESEGYASHALTVHRRRRDTLGFVLSDGHYETPGSINIDVEPDDTAALTSTTDYNDFDTSDAESEFHENVIEEEVMLHKTLVVPEVEANTGITVEKGTTTVITRTNLQASDKGSLDNSPRYVVVRGPTVGFLQLHKSQFLINVTSSGESEFYQQDIDEGMLRYVHPEEEQGGNFNFRFNVVGASGSTLPEQTFNILVKEDRRPPVIRINDGIAVQEGSSQKITSEKLSASDDVGPTQLLYTITKEPKLGRVEFVNRPGHRIRSFTQSDVNKGKVQYTHTSDEQHHLSDVFAFSLSDGTNKVFQEFFITVLPVDNSLPVLQNKGIRVQEGVRKTITEFELKATDKDTADALVTFTILQSPVHGNIERTNSRGDRYIPVTGFSMEDIYQSRISYNHDGSNSVEDRFTFTVEDGTNKEFIITEEGAQVTTSSHQFFDITILPVDDGTPRLVTNKGLHHLEYMDNKAMGVISKRQLLTEDPDTSADMITYTITSDPRHGHIESNLQPGHPLKAFSQKDVNMGIIRYILSDTSMDQTRDSFMFNVRDSMPNVVTGNIFHIRWSVFTLDKPTYMVKEGAGHIDIVVRRHGNLNYAIVLCRTEPGTATSVTSNTPGQLDYVEHAGQVQFDEHEDEKVCTIEIKDDSVYEGTEQFTVLLAQPNYALLGSITETTVTIDDSEDKPTLQFDESEKVVQENDDTFFLTIRRTGDINKKVTVICHTQSGTATGSSASGHVGSGSDYKSRDRNDEHSVVVFEPGVSTATCDVKLIDDSIYEEDEQFTVKLTDPSSGAQVGEMAKAEITIAGPNDAASVFFSNNHYEFSENQGTVDVTVVRTGSDLSQSTDVWCATRAMDPVSAVPGEDFVQSSNKVTFRTGETTKVCSMMILDDSQAPSVEGNETFEVYLSSVLRAKLVTPHHAVVTINDTLDDIPTMEFLKTSVEVKEKDKLVSLAITREGDISSSSSVICYTRRNTAEVEQDFNERANTETSRIVFKPGQKLAYCNVTIVDDNSYESSERFSVHLTGAIGSKWYGATVGEKKVVEITITNDEDAPTIMFERAEFSIREPDFGEESRQLVVKVIRTGDANEISKVRCSTRDGSATSGSDYEPKSRMLRFQPGDTEVSFRVNILPNDDTEWHETFLLVLGPDDPVNAVLGPISQATVTVLDKDAAGSLILPTTPVVVSLLNYDNVKEGLETNPSPGYPLVCVTPCDPRYPEYADTRNHCEEAGINASAIIFSWEVAMPTNIEGGGSQPFEKVQDETPFTSVNTKVLDSIYFARRFHVRCIAQAVDSQTGTAGTPLRSNVATISTDSGLCHNPIMSGTERGFQAQSFIAKLDYIPPTSEEHPDSLQISVEIPHQDGRLPLISTMPFNNLKLLLSRSIDRQQHLCSNMMYNGKTVHVKPSDLVINDEELLHDIGKYLGFIEPTDYSKLSLGPGFDKPFQLDPTVREPKSIDLYKYLNLKSCVWKFKAHYKMNQLIDYCNGKVDPDYHVRDSPKSLVTVTVPLHVSYVYVTAPTGWGALEHRTEMEFSFLYDGVMWKGEGIQTEGDRAAKFQVTKMKSRDDGRLEIIFETIVQFRGLFVLEHHTLPGRKSAVIAPDGINVQFELENVWNENKFDSPHQHWRAVSKYSKKDYSGEYEIQLLPCTVTPTAKWKPIEPGQEVSCTAYAPVKFKLPITFQQTSRPVPVVYSLNTEFHLGNNEKLFLMDPREAKESELDYKGSFSKGQTIFGRVLWSPDQDLHNAYKLQLEKVYLCTGRDGYIPTYDPEGTVYHQGPQYGCIQPSRSLQHRFLLLDRSSRDAEDKYFHDVSFGAHFASDVPDYAKLAELPGVDGFLIRVDALYKVEAGHQWYLQVMYAIGPEDMMLSRRRRAAAIIPLHRKRRSITDDIQSYRNGTNMKGIVVEKEEGAPATLIAIGVSSVVLPILFCCLFALCCVRRRRRKQKGDKVKQSHIVVVQHHDKKCVDDDISDQESGESWPLSSEKEHKRSNSAGLATVVSVKKQKYEKNYQRNVNVNDVEMQPLNRGQTNNTKPRSQVGKSRKKKSIPIVDNLRMNNEEDGTEV